MCGRPGVASARRALHDMCCRCYVAFSPILSCSLLGLQTWPPPGPVSQGALCTPHVLANAVNKAMFSVLVSVRLHCIEWGRGPRVLCADPTVAQ